MADLPPSNDAKRQAPHVKIDMSDEESDADNNGYTVGSGYRHSGDSDDVRMDEEEMRQANQDVMQMQQEMMDRNLTSLFSKR